MSEGLLALRPNVTLCVSVNKQTENSIFIFEIFFFNC